MPDYQVRASYKVGREEFSAGAMNLGTMSARKVLGRGSRKLGPSEAFYVPLNAGAPHIVGVNMKRGGLGVVVPRQKPQKGGIIDSHVALRPGLIVDLSATEYDKSAGIVAPFYSDGKWIKGPEQGTPDFRWMHSNILGPGSITAQVHPPVKRYIQSIELPVSGNSWREVAWRYVWGKHNFTDLTGLHFMMAMVGFNNAQSAVPWSDTSLNRPHKILMELTSYPWRVDLREDHPAIVDPVGTATDVKWNWTSTLELPSVNDPITTQRLHSISARGWTTPYVNSAATNTLLPAVPMNMYQAQIQWVLFPFSRGLHTKTNDPFDATLPERPYHTLVNYIDLARITAIQMRMLWSTVAGEGGTDEAKLNWGGIVLTWNTFDGALAQPEFFTDNFVVAPSSDMELGILNASDHEEVVEYLVAEAGVTA